MLLVGINSKFTHSNLAIRYMVKCDSRFSFREFSIADRPETIARELFSTDARVFLFSCYIWNIETVLKVAEILKKADPGFFICLGGPEVSFRAEGILEENPFLDAVLTGEAEMVITPFGDAVATGDFSLVPGLYLRRGESVVKNLLPAKETAMEDLPFPYDETELSALSNRIVYYETSRGCPYRCAFCLSGAAGSLRFMDTDRVARELTLFENNKVPLVKFIDRTFNADPRRALSIIEGIKERDGETCYHFEIRAETMTNELINALKTAKKGLFQLEIGVQSTNPEVLCAIGRTPDFERLSEVVSSLSENKNLHLHLDLIAGLPGENMESFLRSFHQVIAFRPDNLQLGFLKKLSGSSLMAPESEFASFPPYEIVKSDKMSHRDLLRLKRAEEMLERYYNSGAYPTAVPYLLDTFFAGREFTFFEELAEFLAGDLSPKSLKTQFEELYRFAYPFAGETFREKLTYDYARTHRDTLSFMKKGDYLKEQAFAFLKEPQCVAQYFTDYAGEKPAVLYKKIRFVPIGTRIIAFDDEKGRVEDVTKEFELEE
ncbi:MAG: DUF4080 domain-containing protein [Clostridia bacterium]|nr:DUF4080 domain-containing protein [Clostridia bacterium]